MSTNSSSLVPQGIILILIGLVAFFMPLVTAYSITTILGILLIITGVFYVFGFGSQKGSGDYLTQIFFGIVGIVIGILLLIHGLTILSILIGIWFTLFGLQMFYRAFTNSSTTLGMILLVIAGIVAILFAIDLFTGWPYAGLSVMGQLLGIVLVLQGISFLFAPSANN